MEQINIGLKIKQLRKERKLTQEMLAEALDVTPQAVSKWEMSTAYPDITLIPVIANYFEVSLDTLFDFDPSKKNEKIKAIIDEASNLFFGNTKECIGKIKAALVEYPENEKLLNYLLECYEYDLRANGCRDGIESMFDISQKLIAGSVDHEIVVNAKIIRSAAFFYYAFLKINICSNSIDCIFIVFKPTIGYSLLDNIASFNVGCLIEQGINLISQ